VAGKPVAVMAPSEQGPDTDRQDDAGPDPAGTSESGQSGQSGRSGSQGSELIARGKARAIAAILGLSLLNGLVSAHFGFDPAAGPSVVDLASLFAVLGAGFYWLHLDGLQTGFRRSPAFNVGIVLIGIVFVPLYFIRSRPAGQRLLPVLGYFGLVLSMQVSVSVGAWLSGFGATPTL